MLSHRILNLHSESMTNSSFLVLQAVADANIFVFALNLEYMEADFYAWAAHVRLHPFILHPRDTPMRCWTIIHAWLDVEVLIPTISSIMQAP